MGTIRVEWKGVSEAIAALRAWGQREQGATKSATREVGDAVQGQARSNFQGSHPYTYPHVGGDRPNTVSGRLQASILPTPVARTGWGAYTVNVGPTTVYGRIIELGGTIEPTAHKYLSWFSYWLGAQQYRTSVHLDGWPYLKPAVHESMPVMQTIFTTEWTAAIYG